MTSTAMSAAALAATQSGSGTLSALTASEMCLRDASSLSRVARHLSLCHVSSCQLSKHASAGSSGSTSS